MAQYSTAASDNTGLTQPDSQSAQLSASAHHKRVYQACIPCRRRKVRCDLGSVDDPHDPPCVRCRRESKECFFSATRRKRKTEDGEGSDVDEYVVRNGRKRVNAEDTPPARQPERKSYVDTPLTPGGSHGRSQPLRRPDTANDNPEDDTSETRSRDFAAEGDANAQLENLEAQTVMRRGMYGPHDALDLLYKAATDRLVDDYASTSISNYTNIISPVTTHGAHRREESTASIPIVPQQPVPGHREGRSISKSAVTPMKSEAIDPDLSGPGLSGQPGYEDALNAWSRFRFVRAGWFTAQEAVEYID